MFIWRVPNGFDTYEENDDLARIQFRQFNHDESAIYPTITLCFSREIVFTKGNYEAYQTGLNLEFDVITLNVEDFLFAMGMKSSEGWSFRQTIESNGTVTEHGKVIPQGKMPHFYISYQDFATKCFSLDFTFRKGHKISYVGLLLYNYLFPEETEKHPNFGVFLHYPGQLLLEPTHNLFRRIRKETSTSEKYHYIKIQSMDVINRRNKNKSPCKERAHNYDEEIVRHMMEDTGCKPPYWNVSTSMKPCDNEEQLLKLSQTVLDTMSLIPTINETMLERITQPCKEIANINFDYGTVPLHGDLLGNGSSYIEQMVFYFHGSSYKEIKQIREMDWEGYVSYAGGYIGLYLGFGIMQIPGLLLLLSKNIVTFMQNSLGKKHTKAKGKY